MKKLLQFSLAALICLPLSAQVKIKGVLNNNRYDDGDQLKNEYLGWNSELGKAIFIVDNGIYAMTVGDNTVSTPVREPAVVKEEVLASTEKMQWATDFNLMYGNSGAVYVDGQIVTVMSRDEQSTTDDELFAVRKWDATTGDLLTRTDLYLNKSANIESAGMSYNPIDGKVYGFFYISDAQLLEEITSDPEYFTDEDDADFGREGLDAGYCLGTIDLKTMKITPITPGLYYGNYIAFAINSEGRAFVLTSGGTNGYEGADGKIYNIDNKLGGAQLIEIDTKTGLMVRNSKEVTDPETGETYTEYSYPYPATGYCTQVRRQAACFSKSNPNKLYWIGFYNSGKGINASGSWTTLDNREWRTNGLYDTALYEIDLITGVCTRVAKVPNRCSFSCIWIDGDDCSDGENIDIVGEHDNDSTITVTYNIEEETILKTTVQKGELRLTLQPKDGWKISTLLVNNVDNLANLRNNLLTIDVQTRTDIEVSFEWANADNLYSEVTTDGIVNIEGENVKVKGADGQILVDGAAGKTVKVYTTGGRLITSATPSANKTAIFTLSGGAYIVQVGSKAAKVSVR